MPDYATRASHPTDNLYSAHPQKPYRSNTARFSLFEMSSEKPLLVQIS